VNWAAAERIANAVLYEGYLLYPYRPSALKNRRQWMFGVLYPPAFCLRERAGDRFTSRTVCLLEGVEGTRVAAKLRFLQSLDSSVVEREVTTDELPVGALLRGGDARLFRFEPLEGGIELSALRVADGLLRIELTVANRSAFQPRDREEALSSSLLSCHTLLATRDGAFVPLTDPPIAWAAHAEQCTNEGTWPVLVGDPARRELVLSSPIILPDYPAVAPESHGDLFDGTEIDELLSLRIRTLSDAEKAEMSGADERARRLLERTEALSAEELLALHGTWRRVAASAAAFHPGQRVRLRPARRADIFDLELRGRTATVVAVEVDLEGRDYVAVTVEGDPGADLGAEGRIGHRFYFGPEELEAL
jgi:hypothetical protein